MLKSEQEEQKKEMQLSKEEYQLKLNQMEQLKNQMKEMKETNEGLLNDIVDSNKTIEQQTVQINFQEEQIAEKSKLMEEEKQKFKQNQIRKEHEQFMTSSNGIII